MLKMFVRGGHLGFNSSVHSLIKNLVEGGGQLQLIVVALTQQINLLQRRLNVRGGLIG